MKLPISLKRTDRSLEPLSMDSDEFRFPSFTISSDTNLDLPDEGEMKISFVKTRESEEKENGRERYECRIQVRSIVEVEGEDEDDEPKAPAKSDRTTEEALDALAEALHAEPKSHSETPGKVFKTTVSNTKTDEALDALATALHAHELADKDADD